MALAYTDRGQSTDYKKEIDEMHKKHGFRKPVRSFLDKDGVTWRDGKPNYDRSDYYYLKGKTQNHSEGSLEVIVEDLVKTYEMEVAHKLDPKQMDCIDHSNGGFHLSVNGRDKVNLNRIIKDGIYNLMLQKSPLWKNTTYEESHEMFHKAFIAFPFEILKVFSGPPNVAFTWRHWAEFVGEYKENKGNGDLIEMIGFGIAEVNEKLQIKYLSVYFDQDSFIEVLEGKKSAEELRGANYFVGDIKCPFASK